MYLLRIKGKRLYSPPAIYLYIRCASNIVNQGLDIPLGRFDQGEPQCKVKAWIKSSENMPYALQYTWILDKNDVKALYIAIIENTHWFKWEWRALYSKLAKW